MPYLGRGLEKGNYLKLDDISSQFDGSKTTFNLTVGGSAHVPGSSYSLLVSLSGIVQEGEAAYTLDQNEITFAAAPQAADDCFIISLGTPLGIGVPSNGTVNGTQLAKPLNYDNFFHLDHTNDRVGIGTSLPTQSLDVYDGNIAIRDPATASQFLGFYHNRNVLKASIDKTGNNLTFENVDSGIIDYKIGGSSRVSIGSTGKIFFGTDDNTYFYRPGADTLGFLTGGIERLRIESGGDVGIGTVNPHKKLHVVKYGGHGAVRIEASGDTNRSGIEFYRETSAGTGKGGAAIWVESDTSSTNGKLRFGTASNASVQSQGTDMILDHNGRLGIGTTNPDQELHVKGQIKLTDSNYARVEYARNNTNLWSVGVRDTDDFWFFRESGSAHVIFQHGNVGIGSTNPGQKLVVNGGSALDTATFNSNHANGVLINLQRSGTSKGFLGSGKNVADATGGVDDIGLRANANLIFTSGGGTERLRIDTSGHLTLQGGKIYGEDNASNSLHLQSTSGNSNHSRIEIGTIQSSDNGGIHFYTAGSSTATRRITIKGTSGYVGIGEDDPVNHLVVQEANASDDVGIRVKNDTTTDGNATNPTTASLFLNTSTSTFNTFYIQARRNDNNTHFGYADPRTVGHTPTMCITGNSKRVGINTSDPAYPLDVVGDGGGSFSASSLSTNGQLSIVGRNSAGGVSAISRLKSYPDGSSNQSHFAIETRNSSNTMVEALRINSSGLVGIGTTVLDTSATLSLCKMTGSSRIYMKSSSSADCSIIFGAVDDAATGAIRYDHSDDTLRFMGHNNSQKLYIDANSVIVAGGAGKSLHASRTQAKFGIDCHTLDIFDGVNDPSNYGMVFYNDPNTDKANGIGFFNDDGQTCGGYIVHQDKGSGNIGDIIFATSEAAGTPVERARIRSFGGLEIGPNPNVSALDGDGTGTSFTSQGMVLSTPAYVEYQYTWGGQSDFLITLTCGSYFHCEFTYVQHQTNGGNNMQNYARGKWANNHTTHTGYMYEFSGQGTNAAVTTTFTVSDQNDNGTVNLKSGLTAAGASGATYRGEYGGGSENTSSGSGSATGKFVIDETYNGSGLSASTRALIIKVYFGTFSIAIA